MQKHYINAPGKGRINDTTAFAVLGVAALMMVGFAMSAVFELATGQDQFAATPSISAPAVAQHQAVTSVAARSLAPSPFASEVRSSRPRAVGVSVPVDFRSPGTSSGTALVVNF